MTKLFELHNHNKIYFLFPYFFSFSSDYCCHVWAGAPSCYLELFDKLQKRISRIVGPSLAACLEPGLIAEMQPDITLVDIHLNWFNWFHLLILEEGLLVILIDCMIFPSPFLDVTMMFMSTVSFLGQLDSGILCLQNTFL